MSSLSLTGVGKRYGPVHAVRALDLEVHEGEVLTVVGPSGCGKSTLLRLVAGLEHADTGRITVGGEVVDDGRSHRPPERRSVGLVFQDHALFPHLDVRRNVAFGLHRWERAERGRRVEEVLDLVGLVHLADRLPHELSGGEQQRVALARALAPRPAVVLLDEPFSSLDENLRARVRTDTLAALRRTGSAALLVTHDQDEALSLGDRIAVMRAGAVEQVGTPVTVYETPATRFVASFMGDADFLPATLEHGRAVCEIGDLPVAAPDGGAALDVALRPHEVDLVPDPGSDARVERVEFHGASALHVVRLPSGRLLRVSLPQGRRQPEGTAVAVTVAAGARPVLLAGDAAVGAAPDAAG